MRCRPLVLAIGLAVTAATAQAQEPRGPRAMAGGSLGMAIPVGEFENFVDVGYGFGGFFLLNLDRRALFGLRLDASGLIYGSETRRRPLSETIPFVRVDVTTRNQIFWLGVGPQVTWPHGVLRPYGNLGIGISYFATESGVKGSGDVEEFAETTNFDDLTFEWHSGGGLLITISRSRTPVFLDFSLRHIQNGRVRYLREGSIEEARDGTISFTPIESETNLLWLQFGVSIGLSPWGGRGFRGF